MKSIRLFLLLLSMAFSLGGFTFYASVVIPIGSDILDSTTQGFVTQKVTHVLNIANCVTLALVIWYGASLLSFGNSTRNRGRCRLYFSMSTLFAICLGTLLLLHPQLDDLLNPEDFSVVNAEYFYRLHQAYLWISTLHWITSIGLLWVICLNHGRFAGQ